MPSEYLSLLLFLPVGIQGMLMFVDEFVFHRRRGLPLWERIGHPVDAVSVLVCLLIPIFAQFNTSNLILFAALGLFSCLLITKDEFVHSELCNPIEQWIHSVLFVLHPLVFVGSGMAWYLFSQGGSNALGMALQGQAIFVSLFLVYQITYWLIIYAPPKAGEIES